MVFHVHIGIVFHPCDEIMRLVGDVPRHGSNFSGVETRRSMNAQTVAEGIAVQLGIVLLQNVGYREELTPRLLSAYRPRQTFILRRNLNDICGHSAVSRR